ncbi:MFS transporter [Bifidobacterium avesanii]|uniref:MFS transporter n=1 Tax=Bifidobacterium avesanii TaxID=1798157 RepID=A0A7K3TG35_9BIFI|nr:MFS transporter [Bifidobacterium avesanii]KAB8294553.1 permease [Bifidobacterium avesanii]NEG78065.1 MFS transporter [Bifidobacterium avesanii]
MAQPSHSLWKSRRYRLWFASDSADSFSRQLRLFAVPLIALSLSNSQFVAGLTVAAGQVVAMLCMPFGGVLADRHDRRRMMLWLGGIGTALALVTAAGLWLHALNPITFGLLMVLFALNTGLLGPSNNAILKSLIPLETFARAHAMRETRESVLGMASGAIAGALYRASSSVPFLGAAALHAASSLTAIGLPANDPTRDGESRSRQSFWSSLREGLAWAAGKPRFLWFTVSATVMNVACYAETLGVSLMLAARGTDPVLIGLVDTGAGVGMLLGSLCAVKISDTFPSGLVSIANCVVFTACLVSMTVSADYAVILACMTVSSFLFPADNAGMLGFIYGKIPVRMQGRADAVLNTGAVMLSAFVPALVGWMLQSGPGFHGVMVMCCVFALVTLAITALTSLRTIPAPSDWADAEL